MTPKKKSSKKAKPKSRKAPGKRIVSAKKKAAVSKKKTAVPNKKMAAKRISRGAVPKRRSQRASTTRDRELLQAPPSPDDVGLSDAAGADSESVDELLDEGNAFEAGVVSGVERADDSEEQEVRTKEVPEDDVPDEYLDNDR